MAQSSAAQRIKERLPINEVLGGYMELQKSGSNFKARCPFHNEKTPSFFVSPDRGTYYCFGCGAKGDIFSFTQDFENIDFVGALKILADKAGVNLGSFNFEKNNDFNLYEINEEAMDFFSKNIKDNNEALLYLKKRGLSIELLRDWKLGFATDGWRDLKEYFFSKGVQEKDLLDAGLIKVGEGGSSYDRFRGRIIFPIFDSIGRTVGFSGRILKDSPNEPKYLNSPETKIFEKSKVLYGMHKAKFGIREKGFTVLVEGQMDLLMCHQIGFSNTVASSGTAFTSNQAGFIKKLTDTLVILFDADSAGRDASLRAYEIALASGLEVKLGIIPSGEDPASVALSNPKNLEDSINNAVHIVDYFLNSAKNIKNEGNQKQSDTILKTIILPLVASVDGAIAQSRWIQKISLELQIKEEAIWEDLSKIKISDEKKDLSSAILKNDKFRGPRHKIMLLHLALLKSDSDHNFLADGLKDIVGEQEVGDIFEEANKSSDKLSFEAEFHFGNAPNNREIISESLYSFEEDYLKNRMGEAMEKLKRAEAVRDSEKIKKLLEECQLYSSRLSSLQKKYFHPTKIS